MRNAHDFIRGKSFIFDSNITNGGELLAIYILIELLKIRFQMLTQLVL